MSGYTHKPLWHEIVVVILPYSIVSSTLDPLNAQSTMEISNEKYLNHPSIDLIFKGNVIEF